MSVKSSALNVERSASIDADNPWPGLASFTEDTRAFFFGREEETEELVRLIKRNTLTVLFGQSGLGKSSLLQAGAFPVLREADYLPLYLRLDHAIETSEVARVSRPVESTGQETRAALADQVKAALVEAFKSVGAEAPTPRADETLWEYFHRKDVDIWSAKNRLLTPVLAFDQFEEIFTLGRATEAQRERGRAFLIELADLVENRAPAALRAKFDAGELDISRYNFDKPSCQVVLSLREDFLPDLEGLKHEMRSILHSRMRVKRLNGAQALEIVTRPAPHLIADGVGERIVEFVAGARGGSAERLTELEVEPALLSVICRELNERRRALGQSQITADLVSGNRREILTDFYERSVADLPEGMRAFVEDHLLTKSGFRDNLALETALEFPGVTRPLIDTLVSRRLLRIEDRLGVQRVELTHDVLAEVIRASRDARQQRLATEQLRQRERITRRRMWLARTIAAGLLVGLTGVSWIAWRAIHAERQQTRLRAEADSARAREAKLRVEAEAQELAAKRKAYASDMNGVQYALANENLGRAREILYRHVPKPGAVDLRGWEWRYLWQFCQSDARSIIQEPNDVRVFSVVASADGNWLATTGEGGRNVMLYDLQTKRQSQLPAGSGQVEVAFSPQGSLLAIGDWIVVPPGDTQSTSARQRTMRSRLRIWDVTARKALWESAIDDFTIDALSFTQDGERLIVGGGRRDSGDAAGEVSVWRVSDGTKLAGWPGGSRSRGTAASWFAATRDGSAAAIITAPNRLSVIDLATGRERWSAIATDERPQRIAFSPDGRMLATGAAFNDNAIRLWDAATGRELGRLQGHHGFTTGLGFLADGKHLVSSSADQSLRLWDLETRTAVRSFRGHKTEVYALAISADDRTLYSGCKDGSVYVWDLRTESNAATSGTIRADEPDRILGWTHGDDAAAIVTVDTAGRVQRRAGRMFQENTLLLQLDLPPAFDMPIFARANPLVAIKTRSGKLQVGDWKRRQLVQEWSDNSLMPLDFITDGSTIRLATVRVGDRISYSEWDLETGRETRTQNFAINETQIRVSRILLSPTGSQIAVIRSGNNDSFRLDVRTGRVDAFKLNVLQLASGSAFSADGQILAVPSQSGYLRLFDATTWQEVTTLGGFMFGVHSGSFSADRQRVGTGSTAFETFMLWDLNSHERLLTLPAKVATAARIEFSPDGNVVVVLDRNTAVQDRTLHFWRAPSWAEIEKAEAAATSARPAP